MVLIVRPRLSPRTLEAECHHPDALQPNAQCKIQMAEGAADVPPVENEGAADAGEAPEAAAGSRGQGLRAIRVAQGAGDVRACAP
jgi:hypothetical protein